MWQAPRILVHHIYRLEREEDRGDHRESPRTLALRGRGGTWRLKTSSDTDGRRHIHDRLFDRVSCPIGHAPASLTPSVCQPLCSAAFDISPVLSSSRKIRLTVHVHVTRTVHEYSGNPATAVSSSFQQHAAIKRASIVSRDQLVPGTVTLE